MCLNTKNGFGLIRKWITILYALKSFRPPGREDIVQPETCDPFQYRMIPDLFGLVDREEKDRTTSNIMCKYRRLRGTGNT